MTHTPNRYFRSLALAAFLALASIATVSCGNPSANTPAPVQNSPQSTVALTVKTVADAANTGVKTIIALRDTVDPNTHQGKISATTATAIENWLGFVATTDKQITVILANGQPWAQQKVAILALLGTVTAPAIANTVDPGAQVVIAQIMTLVNQIRAQVQS